MEKKKSRTLGMKLRENWLAFAIAAVFLVAGAVMLVLARKPKPVATVAPGFVLTDQLGRRTSLKQFRGKVVELTFLDPECTQMCPMTTQSMEEAVKQLGPAAERQVELLGVDVNLRKSKVADVAAYTRTHELRGNWRFLTGSPAQLKSVWKSYHVHVSVTADGDIVHSAIVYIIDQDGKERFAYPMPMSYSAVGDQAKYLAQGIKYLLPGQAGAPLPNQASAPQQQSSFDPSKAISVAALGSKKKPVEVGGAHPHLMLFFDSWLGHRPALKKNLAVLDSYAALARRHGWPTPVAVDVMTIEPSLAAARRVLTPLAATLRTPIVEDSSGSIADGYDVGDLPWFVLSSPSGKVVWSHDGWLSASDLKHDVRSALAAN